MSDFLYLDGYGVFVWPAYALALFVMVYFAVTTLTRYKALKSELDAHGGGRRRRRRGGETQEERAP